MGARAPVALVLAPHPDAVSGISTHLNVLFASRLAERYSLAHFQVGSQGRRETPAARLARALASPFALAARMALLMPDIVHVNTAINARGYWRDLAYVAMAKLFGARVVYQVHGGALPAAFAGRNRLARAFLRASLSLPDAVLVLGQGTLAAYREFLPRQRVLAMSNAIDFSPYQQITREKKKSTTLDIVYLGRMHHAKGLYELLDGLRLAREQGVDARLTLAGDGPEEGALRLRVEERGLASVASFAGPVAGRRKLELLARADVFALPSYSEGLPYALLEAMAAGAAVLVSPVGAIPEVAADGVHGVFVPPRDPEAIARALAQLAGDRERLARMGEAGRRRVASAYGIERLESELGAVYAGLAPAPQAA